MAGLASRVEILRDRWGVPHIYAAHEADLFFGQGYAHAQDRFWQMELSRRVGHGQLAELFGEVALPTDRLLRTIGMSRAASASWRATDGATAQLFDAYAAGVNAFLETGKRPLELRILGAQPRPWRPVDSLVWTTMMDWGLAGNWESELLYGLALARLGADKTARLWPSYPAQNPIIAAPAAAAEPAAADALQKIVDELQRASAWLGAPAGPAGGSNNWVVDGKKSVTGQPLLANDPHLALQMPGIWYENHLSCPRQEAIGASLPGVPGVVLGHNRQVAWGVTAGLCDTQDLFFERITDDAYLFEGSWRPLQIVDEEITVKGRRSPHVERVRISHHGPILTGIDAVTDLSSRVPQTKDAFTRAGERLALALAWTGHQPSRVAFAAIGLGRAANWQEWREVVARFDGPTLNMVYADRAGNIGYQLVGRTPVRKRGRSLVPVLGWTGEDEWVGTVPFDEMPSVKNPPAHFLASANNRIAPADYPHYLGDEPMSGFRAARIVELLTQKVELSLDDFRALQLDQKSLGAPHFCRFLVENATALCRTPDVAPRSQQAERALALVRDWDFVVSADSVAATIYEATQHFALRRLLEPQLGALTPHFMGVGFHPVVEPIAMGFFDRAPLLLVEILTADDRAWLPDGRVALLGRALAAALDWLETTLGADVAQWQWGRLHQAAFKHPLGAQKPLDLVFNRGPFPYGGDANTVWQASFLSPSLFGKERSGEPGFTASYRQLIDLSDWENCRATHTTGQSGHLGSPHYDDFIADWLAGRDHPMLWSRARVEAEVLDGGRLVMEPK